jgi:shikimate dehydrogenase
VIAPGETAGRVVLLGWPVAHSVSPAMHAAAFAELGLEWTYEAVAVPPDEGEVRRAVEALADGRHVGANVTVPHKRAVIPHLARLGDAARATGAVNTISFDPEGRLVGDNTDAGGFLDDLDASGVTVAGRGALIIGAGGAARAVAYALASRGAGPITVAARRTTAAARLAETIADAVPGARIAAEDLSRALKGVLPGAPLTVNCTPVGMAGADAELPVPARELGFGEDHVFYDLVYNPVSTALMRRASARGARSLGGLGMLVRQGARSLGIWTGREAPVEVMERAARERLEELAERSER